MVSGRHLPSWDSDSSFETEAGATASSPAFPISLHVYIWVLCKIWWGKLTNRISQSPNKNIIPMQILFPKLQKGNMAHNAWRRGGRKPSPWRLWGKHSKQKQSQITAVCVASPNTSLPSHQPSLLQLLVDFVCARRGIKPTSFAYQSINNTPELFILWDYISWVYASNDILLF